MIYIHSKKHSIFGAVSIGLIVAVAVFAYNTVSIHKAHAEDPLSSDATATDTSSPLSPEQAALLSKIESIHLKGDIFNDTAYKSLVDLRVEIPRLPTGKTNPFASAPTNTVTKKK